MAAGTSYLLCGTPRTGSTLLCSLLSSTGVLGRPDSYFREADETAWAARLGLPTDGERVRDYDAYVRAVRRAASTDNGVFAARIMWGSMGRLIDGLRKRPGETELACLERAFGPLACVHLSRQDVVAQAVSWCRAEQTGYWQHGDSASRPPEKDLARLQELVATVVAHNAAWQTWFDSQGVRPHPVTYEGLTGDRRATVEGVARHVGVALPQDWRPTSRHRKQADETNGEWAAALRVATESSDHQGGGG